MHLPACDVGRLIAGRDEDMRNIVKAALKKKLILQTARLLGDLAAPLLSYIYEKLDEVDVEIVDTRRVKWRFNYYIPLPQQITEAIKEEGRILLEFYINLDFDENVKKVDWETAIKEAKPAMGLYSHTPNKKLIIIVYETVNVVVPLKWRKGGKDYQKAMAEAEKVVRKRVKQSVLGDPEFFLIILEELAHMFTLDELERLKLPTWSRIYFTTPSESIAKITVAVASNPHLRELLDKAVQQEKEGDKVGAANTLVEFTKGIANLLGSLRVGLPEATLQPTTFRIALSAYYMYAHLFPATGDFSQETISIWEQQIDPLTGDFKGGKWKDFIKLLETGELQIPWEEREH